MLKMLMIVSLLTIVSLRTQAQITDDQGDTHFKTVEEINSLLTGNDNMFIDPKCPAQLLQEPKFLILTAMGYPLEQVVRMRPIPEQDNIKLYKVAIRAVFRDPDKYHIHLVDHQCPIHN